MDSAGHRSSTELLTLSIFNCPSRPRIATIVTQQSAHANRAPRKASRLSLSGKSRFPIIRRFALSLPEAIHFRCRTPWMPSDVRPLIGIIMGSQSDWPTLNRRPSCSTSLKVRYSKRVWCLPIGRPNAFTTTPRPRADRGLKAIIAGAGGAAHLARHDSVYDRAAGAGRSGREPRAQRSSTVFCPSRRCRAACPVATFAIGEAGAKNAGLFAAALFGDGGQRCRKRLERGARVRRARLRLSPTRSEEKTREAVSGSKALRPASSGGNDRHSRRRSASAACWRSPQRA